MAVADDTFVGVNESGIKTGFRVYPNPGKGNFNIDVDQPGTLKIYDVAGKLQDTKKVNRRGVVTWNAASLTHGTYIMQYCSVDNKVLGSEQIVVLKN